jgi:hypothetical protein
MVRTRLIRRPTSRQLGIIALLITVSILTIGAARVTGQLVHRPRHAEVAEAAVRGWGHDIAAGMPLSQRPAWEELVVENPVLVLSVCSVKLPSPGDSHD